MKHLLLCLAVIFSMNHALAQSSSYANRMNHIFGLIDKTKVTTGFLKEFGIRFNCMESYNGVLSDTNHVDVTQWKSLYNSLYSMRVGMVASSMAHPATVFSHLTNQQVTNPEIVLLAAQYYSYQQYKVTAYTNGDVMVTNESIRDVAGRNPYDTETAFAVTPMESYLKGNSFAFKLQSNMIYTNSSQTLASVQIDFGNGQGYQTISVNTIKNVNYTTGGEKELKVKFVYNGGSTVYSHSKLYVDYQTPVAQARFNGGNLLFDEEPVPGEPYLGTSAIGDVTVELAPGHAQITKPLIVVEGFDPFDSFDYDDFINEDEIGGIDVDLDPNLSVTYTLNEAIEDEGYDLVFINYSNGTDYIQRNAYMVEAVIDWVNDHKIGDEKNVVLGMSMGGLVARYALSHMESMGKIHETKLYISHDAPHQGANVPLAYQAFVRHLAGESLGWPVFLSFFTLNVVDVADLAPSLKDGLALLQSPAAQQMLIYQLSGTGSNISINNNSLYHTFLTEYQNLGYPTQNGIRNIAISNGSECGTPLDFQPYSNLANLNEKVDLPFFTTNIVFTVLNAWSVNPIKAITSFLSTDTDVKVEFNMKSLPNQQAQRIYKGKIYIKKTVLWVINVEEQLIAEKTLNSAANMLSLDNVAGGVYDINQFVSLPPDIEDYILETRFNFIPTYSSLDIGNGSQPIIPSDLTRAYSTASAPPAPKNTPFDNFFTNPAISENHIQFTLNNGKWLLAELKGENPIVNCSYVCANTPIAPFISGTSTLCASSTYSITNLPSPSPTIIWSSSNTSNVTITAAGVASKVGSYKGYVTIQAVLTGGCGTSSQYTKSVWVGTPELPGAITGRTQLTPGLSASYFIQAPVRATSYKWIIPSGCYAHYCWEKVNQTQTSLNVRAGDPGYDGIEYKATNSCGTNTRSIMVNVQNPNGGGGGGGGGCGPMLAAAPNPAKSNDITINIIYPPDPCDDDMRMMSVSTLNEINNNFVLVDGQGVIQYEGTFSGKELKFEKAKLKRGLYIILVEHKGIQLKSRLAID